MALHHRHKQRLLTTVILLIIFVVALDTYLILAPALTMETALLFAFTVAIGLTVAYQCYNYRHSHEHVTLVNTLTQIFLGTILFTAAVIMLLLQTFAGIDIIDSYLYLSLIVIFFTFLFLKRFDEFLEREAQVKFPMGHAPVPKAGPVKKMTIQRRQVGK
jgi:FlaA1/EpsC-like NDP-sugar epimerase